MTERLIIFTGFVGTALHNGTTIRQVAPYDTEGVQAVTRLYRLSNGTVFDADGTADGATTFGTITVTMRVTGANPGAVNTTLETLQGLLNKRGALVGAEYGASSTTTKTCTARLIAARPVRRDGLPMATGRTFQVDLEMTFQRFTAYT